MNKLKYIGYLIVLTSLIVGCYLEKQEPPKTKGGDMHYFKPDIYHDTVSDYISNCGGHCWRSPWQNH